LLAFLARRLRDCGVLLVATAREDELDETPALGTFARELASDVATAPLSLGPLSRGDTTRLVRILSSSRIKEADLERLDVQVWRLSEGHPFVAVETVRAIAEGATPRPTQDAPLPRRVHELITSRIERATPAARELTAVAAVIGREFDFALLNQAAGGAEADAARSVEELVRRRVLHGIGERFEFTHDRIRQVVYAQILGPRRALLHRQVAGAIERLYGTALEPHHAALVHHCREGGLWRAALRYLGRVAERAARSSAHAEALATLEEASACVPHLPAADRDRQGIDLVLRQARSLFFLGRFQETLARLRDHESVVARLADPRLAGRFHFMQGNTHVYLAQMEDAAASARQAIIHAAACGDEVTLGKGGSSTRAARSRCSTGPARGGGWGARTSSPA
jgi:predicted ATPase